MDRRQFIQKLTFAGAGAGLAQAGLASANAEKDSSSAFFQPDGKNAARKKLDVQYEWSPLREVVVGYPFLKLSNNFPPATQSWLKFPPEYQQLFEFWLTNYPGKTLEEIANDTALPDPKIRELYLAQVGQINAVIRLLESRGIIVHQIPPLSLEEQAYLANLDGNAVQLFPRDPILVVGHHYFELPLLLPYRRRERFAIRHVTEELLYSANIPINSAPEPYPLPGAAKGVVFPTILPYPLPSETKGFGYSAFLEGGDVLVFGKRLLVGLSGNASNMAGVDWLKQQLGPSYSIETVPLRADFLHLDVALCTPRPGLALVCRNAFLRGLPRFLKGWTLIDVAEQDALEYLACNALILDKKTLVVTDKPAYVGDQLEKAGQLVYRMPFDMVTPLGGGFRCWHHPLRRSR